MGLVKSQLDDMQEERKDDWIRDYIGLDEDDELDELSADYLEAEYQYQELQDHLADEAWYQFELEQEQEREIEWLKRNPHLTIYNQYLRSLNSVLSLNSIQGNEALLKMQVAYCVTILESCLSEMLKSVVLSSRGFLENAVSNVKDLQNSTVSLKEVLKESNIIEKRVMNHLSELLYHNIPKVLNTYQAVLNTPKPKGIQLSEVIKLTSLRHDIVHRDGKSLDGVKMSLSEKDVTASVKLVREFLTAVSQYITSAVDERHQKIELQRLKEIPPF